MKLLYNFSSVKSIILFEFFVTKNALFHNIAMKIKTSCKLPTGVFLFYFRKSISNSKQNKIEVIKSEKGLSSTILNGLLTAAYSQMLSHYCWTRELLPAVFPPWAGSFLIIQPGEPRLPRVHHIDAQLSADTRST